VLDSNFAWSTHRLDFSVDENTVEVMHRPKEAEAFSYLLNLPPIYPPQ
jgi:hypothetical protein